MKNKLPKNLTILSLEKRTAKISFTANFDTTFLRVAAAAVAKLKDPAIASLWTENNNATNFNFDSVADVLPIEEDFIYVPFRALSKRLIPGYFLDLTQANVLKDSVAMLQGRSVYPNHDRWSIENVLGAVATAEWDETGEKFGGVPGINVIYKIDALMNPRVSRGLLMKPPSINATSMTFWFEFDFSHPRLVEEGKFWVNLGEEIEGEIVRLIVTKIIIYLEASLVALGADDIAQQPADDEEEESFSAAAAEFSKPSDSIKENTMKLTAEVKKALAIESDSLDVPDADVLTAVNSLAARSQALEGVDLESLQAKAAIADSLFEEKRTEVTRLAKLAELGAGESELDPAVAQSIADADTVKRLESLRGYYDKKASERFPQMSRSSMENTEAVHAAGGVDTKAPVESDTNLYD